MSCRIWNITNALIAAREFMTPKLCAKSKRILRRMPRGKREEKPRKDRETMASQFRELK